MILGGSVLSALTIGIAVEAAFSPSVPRPGLAGVVTVGLLGCVIVCWLRATALLLLAGRPVLDQLNDHRWRTGAPLDPRVRWLSTPTAGDGEAAWSWAHVNMMLGATRVRRERIQRADTWTFITAACFLLWTAGLVGAVSGAGPARLPPPSLSLLASPALPGPPSSVPPMAQRAGKTCVLPRGLSTAREWLIVEPGPAPTRWPAAGLPR
jgi:hypothetical protein